MEERFETQNDLSEDQSANQLEWKTHPMKKRPRAAILVTVFIFIIAGLVYSMTESNIFPTLTLIVWSNGKGQEMKAAAPSPQKTFQRLRRGALIILKDVYHVLLKVVHMV